MWHITSRPHLGQDDQKQIWIEIRDSQHKYMPPDSCDWMLEVVKVSGPSTSKNIGAQMARVLKLAQSKRSKASASSIEGVLIDAIRRQQFQRQDSLFSAQTPEQLRYQVQKMERKKPSKQGARNTFFNKDQEDKDLLQEERAPRHPDSLRPDRPEAQAKALLDAGFYANFPPLYLPIVKMEAQKQEVEESDGKIILEGSGQFYAITDPTGVLDEHEVFLQTSGVSVMSSMVARTDSPSG